MGTRADFYVGLGKNAEWVGSIAWDGYPRGLVGRDRQTSAGIIEAKSEAAFREAVVRFLVPRKDATAPDMGWPWPWNDSNTTDYAYCFDGAGVRIFNYGSPVPKKYHRALIAEEGPLWDEWCEREDDQKESEFPDMSARKNVNLGERSGLIILG